MRRTDEAFKNELFRRYEQYKKNRRNLRLLAAAPGVVSAMLVCALLFLPKLSLFEANEPVGDQPNETPLVQPDETTDRVVETTTAPPDTDPETPDDSSDGDESDDSLPSITEDEVQAILDTGGDLQTLIYYIGEPHRIIYQAAPLYEWDLADGRILRVTLSLQITSNRFTGFQFVDPNALPSITEDEMQALVEAGGTFQDLIDLIGEPHTSVTSGLYTPAWNLADGRMLIVWVTLNELSTPIPIERYEFWESPMCDIVETLERCSIGSITVTEGFDDNAAFNRNYYSQTNIDAIRELIYDCTILRVMGGPTEVDPSTVDTLQGTSRIIRLHCSPAPGYYGDADLYYDIELLDTNNGLFLRFSDFASPDRWFKISPDPFIALWDYVETHDEDSPIGIVPENPFFGITNNPIHTVTVTGPYGTHIYKDDEATLLVKLLDQLTSKVYRETSIDNMDGETFYIEVDWTPEPDATGAIPDEYSRCIFELFGGGFLRAPDLGIEEWYEIDDDAAEALITALNDLASGGGTDETPSISPLDLLSLLERIEVEQIKATVETYYTNSRTIKSSAEIETVVNELKSLARSIKEDGGASPSFSFTGRLYTIVLDGKINGKEESYTLELHEDGYIRCSDGKTVSDWFKIDYTFGDPFRALDVDLDNSGKPFAGFDGGRVLLYNIYTSSVLVKSGDTESMDFTMSDNHDTIINILSTLDSLLRADAIRADQSYVKSLEDKDMLTITLSGSYTPRYPGYLIPDAVLEYTYELVGGKYLRYTDNDEVSEWYEIDEKAGQALIDALRTGNPLTALLNTHSPTSISTNYRYDTSGYSYGNSIFLDWTDEGMIQRDKLVEFLKSLKLTPVNASRSYYTKAIEVSFCFDGSYDHDLFFTLEGNTLFFEEYGAYQIAQSDAETLFNLLTWQEGFAAADQPIKRFMEELDIFGISFALREEILAAERIVLDPVESESPRPDLVKALKEQLASLTLTEADWQNCLAENIDLSICFYSTYEQNGVTSGINSPDLSLYQGRYLSLYYCPGAMHWYEIPESEANDLITLLEKIEADLE